MINLKDIDVQLLARLDANGTDAYDLNFTRIPAINGAQYMVQGAVAPLLESKKFSGEALRDLNLTAVFQTSVNGQIDLDQVLATSILNRTTHKLWTIIAVMPEFISDPVEPVITLDTIDTRSILRPDVRFVAPIKSTQRYTQEEAARARNDIFAPGNRFVTGPNAEYGYTFGTKAITNVGQTPQTMITVLKGGAPARQLVAVSYLKVPDRVPDIPNENDPLYGSTRLEWPESMAEVIISIALRMIAYKQGDGTTVDSLTEKEAQLLISALA